MPDAIPRQVEIYQTLTSEEPFTEWAKSLRGTQYHGKVIARLKNVASGNLGEKRHVGDGVWELKFKTSGGPRIYYGERKDGKLIVLCGGLKGSQDRDIDKAKELWRDHNARQDS